MEKKFNIFEQGAQKNPKPTPKPAPANHPFGFEQTAKDTQLEEFNPAVMTVTDVQNMIGKAKQLHDEIDRHLDDLFQKSGWSIKQIRTYLDNPNNFSSADWEKIQGERKRLLNSLKTDKEMAEAPNEDLKPPSSEPQSKERRSKMIGARRNWIPMR
ncbi:MAG: hypothetical protein LW832_02990 [Parachlamydia sp.]|jgi:hypothetical protein|nr:hypothetical protein [Parachlamydia sp.]